MAIGDLLGAAGVGGLIGQAVVKLELDTAKYQAELKGAQASTVAGTKQMSTGMDRFSALGKAAFLGVGVAAVAGIAVAIKAGSDLNEQLNKSREVFGDAAESVIKFSETTATSLGIAQSEALEASGNFGSLFDAAGLASGAAADMSIKMVQLGADMGSFNNIPVAEALEKIRAGLSGEAEPLRVLGVFLNEARVEAEAFRSGIAEVGTELTDAQKIQARYNIILQDSKKAQGDFARTVGESLPNQLKVLQAELTDTAAALGQELLPIALEVVKAFKAIIPVVKFLADNLGLILATLVGYAAIQFLPALLFNIALALEAVGAASIASGIGNVAGSIASLGSGLAAIAAIDLVALAYLIHKIATGADPTFARELGHELAVIAEKEVPSLEIALESMQQKAEMAGAGMTNLSNDVVGTREHINKTGKAVKNFANMTGEELKDWKQKTKAAFNTFIFSLEDVTTESGVTASDVGKAFGQMKEDAKDLRRAMKELADKSHEWVPEEFIKFLSEQGPDWLIGFAKMTEEQQERAVRSWKKTKDIARETDQEFAAIIGTMDRLDRGQSQHVVKIKYEYVNFDPDKPGMSGSKQPR